MNVAQQLQEINRDKLSKDFWNAVADSLPIMLGVVPFGITYGVMGIAIGLSLWEILLMSLLVFAGAAQFVTISMLGAGITSFGVIVFTTLLVNLRHLIMGASLAPRMIKEPMWLQGILTFGLTDEAYVLVINKIQKSGYSVSYHLGATLALYVVWAAATLVGATFTNYISDPLEWGLDFAIPATFLVMLIPRLKDFVSWIVFSTAALVSVAGFLYLPGKWYIILACIIASVIGGLIERNGKNAQ